MDPTERNADRRRSGTARNRPTAADGRRVVSSRTNDPMEVALIEITKLAQTPGASVMRAVEIAKEALTCSGV